MIDSLTIFSKGGLVLYEHEQGHDPSSLTQSTSSQSLLNHFISSVLLDPTQSTTANSKRTTVEGTILEWEDSSHVLVVTAYPEVVLRGQKSVAWIRHLLQSVLKEYTIFESTQEPNTIPNTTLFEPAFQILLKQAEDMGRNDSDLNSTGDLSHLVREDSTNRNNDPRRLKQSSQQQKTNKKGKEQRVWHTGNAKVTKEAMNTLDYSKSRGDADDAIADDSNALAEARAAYLPDQDEIPSWEEVETLTDDVSSPQDGGWGSSMKGFLDSVSGNKVLTEEDLEAPLADMQTMLTSKNVASDISVQICNSVKTKLVGKRMNSFHRVKTAVRQALEASISKLLQPPKNRDIDLLRAVVTKRDGGGYFSNKNANNRPYTIVMVGINGVGKSTSLAKIAYYLKSKGCNPMLAACDTFRSGAVEQLNVHAKCLDVPLYHKGYAKDPSAVATAAIAQAVQDKNDVVLVDTAGRMQNNVPLMKALSKLVVENQPDLVLFVCEALVGNDGMDQLGMFNKALRSGGHSRQIDGIVLTKFDTVSDKVGAALTMTHVTGAPVVFCGTGQKYNHLKKLSVQSIIKSLFA